MKGGMINQFANNPENGKVDNILKNNFKKDRELNEQIDLFSEIIIDIYLQNEVHHEKRKPTDCS